VGKWFAKVLYFIQSKLQLDKKEF